jgi:CRISPR-associated protein Cas1
MIKRTLFFGNPAYLSTKNEQIVISYPDKEIKTKTVSIEDIGVIVLENQQITITNGLLEKLIKNNVALINCDQQHSPIGLLMPLNKQTLCKSSRIIILPIRKIIKITKINRNGL